MYPDFATKMAQVLTEYSVPVHKGNYVVINANTAALPLIEALYEAIIRRRGHPNVNLGLPNLDEIFINLASDEQLAWINPVSIERVEKVDVYISITSPVNPKAASGVPPERMRKAQETYRPVMEIYNRREQAGEIRWVVAPWPTDGAAQRAEMSLFDYRKFVYEACGLDQPDPVTYWQGFLDRQTKLVNWLAGKKEAKVVGPGIEMTFNFEGRKWISCHGDANFPDGEIFTSPLEKTVNGYVEFSYPTFYGGREINGVRLVFKDGKIVEASAKKNEAYLLTQIDTDEGARYLGEFAIGTNFGIKQVTGSTLFDEKIGGTIHMALGRAYAEANGTNDSLIHWDMVHNVENGGEIYIDGALFYKNGKFVI